MRRCLFACLLLCAVVPRAQAQLRVEKPVIDLSEIRSGPRLTQTFVLVNDGPDTLEIVELRPNCGCALARVDTRFLNPHGRARVTLEVNTFGQAAGPHVWKTTVHWRRGGMLEELALEVRAVLITEVSVQPAALTLFTGGCASHELVLTDRREKPLTIRLVESSMPGLRAELIGHDGGTARIRVQVADDMPCGRHEGVVSVFTDDEFYRHLQVPVRVVKESRSAVSFGPREIDFTASSGQTFPAKLVRIWSAQEAPVQINRIYADDAALVCAWAAGPENQATVKIRVDPTRLTSRRLQSAVHVELCRPVTETITLPVTIEVK